MLLALLIFLLYFLLFFGVGQLWLYYFHRLSSPTAFESFFTGAVMVTLTLSVIHFAFPLGSWILLLIPLTFLFPVVRKAFFDLVLGLKTVGILWLIFGFLVIAFAALTVAGPVTVYDTYLYHDQATHWFSEYSLIPGLANLHGRFGFNNALFTVFATQPQWGETRNYLLHGLFFFMVVLWLSKLFFTEASWQRKAALLTVLVLWVPFSQEYLSSPSPNYHVVVFALVPLLYLLEKGEEQIDPTLLMLFLAFIPTLKLSFAVFAFIMFLGLLYIHRKIVFVSWRPWLVPLLLIGIWTGRNLVLTGQLLYPSERLYLSVFDHSVSLDQIREEVVGIKGWARAPGPGYKEKYFAQKDDFSWVPNWWQAHFNHTFARLPFFGKVSIQYFAGAVLLLFIVYTWQRLRAGKIDLPLMVVFGWFFNLLYWFLNAPSWGFGFGVFLLAWLSIMLWSTPNRIISALALLMICLALPYRSVELLRSIKRDLKPISDHFILPYGLGFGIHGRDLPLPAFQRDTAFNSSRSAYKVFWRPVSGDQCPEDLFPCVPYGVDHVELIERDILSGIRFKR